MISIIEKLSRYADDPEYSGRLCMGDRKTRLSYEKAWHRICGLAAKLNDTGVKSGDCILIQCTQDTRYMISLFASQLAGCIPIPLEKNASSLRVSEIAEISNAAVYIGLDKPKLMIDFLDIDAVYEQEGWSGAFPAADDTAEILFSTGTTGKSKGIELSYSNDIALAENVINGVEMKKDNIELIPMPLSHSHGLRRTYANIYNGSAAVFINGVTLIKQLFDMIDDYKVTSMDLAPAILTMIFRLSGDKLADYREQIDYIQLGSAPLVEEDKEKLSEMLPDTRLYNFYGTTEAGCSCIMDFNEMHGKVGCIGRPAVNAEFIFVDKDRKRIAATEDAPGFMATAGGQNMKGYYKDPELTASIVENGYIYTNDLGYSDEDGLIYYIGREDDVINCGGIKISPDEIEKEVSKHPAVKDCACIPMSDKIQGQVPKLFISLDIPADDFDRKEFSAFLKSALDGNKVPKQLKIIPEIPRTYNGKIQRKKLMTGDQ